MTSPPPLIPTPCPHCGEALWLAQPVSLRARCAECKTWLLWRGNQLEKEGEIKMTQTSPICYWLIDDLTVSKLKTLLTGEALHLLETSLHETETLPQDAVSDEMNAKEFARRFLEPAAQAADRAGLVMAAIAAEVDWNEDETSFSLGNRSSVTQLGEDAYASSAVHDLAGDLADSIR